MANESKVEITDDMVRESQEHVNLLGILMLELGTSFEVAIQFVARKATQLAAECQCEACKVFLGNWERVADKLVVPAEVPRGEIGARAPTSKAALLAMLARFSKPPV